MGNPDRFESVWDSEHPSVGPAKHAAHVWLEEVERRAWKDAGKMAMDVKNRDAFYSSTDYCNIYTSQTGNYGDGGQYFPQMSGNVKIRLRKMHCAGSDALHIICVALSVQHVKYILSSIRHCFFTNDGKCGDARLRVRFNNEICIAS